MVKVSFIIPAYNAAPYINRCLDSIYGLGLALEKFEVIVVDDCSTDNTVEVIEKCRLLNNQYPNFILLKQQINQRQGAARNRGVSVAKGKYIVYVDSDDEVAHGVVCAIEMAENNHLEMVAFRVNKVDEYGVENVCLQLPYRDDAIFTGIELQTEHPFWGTAPWGYVFAKELIEKVGYPFEEGVIFEDSDYVNNHLYAAKRMGYCDVLGYKFRYNSTSTTHTMSYKHIADYFLLGTRMLALYERIDDKNAKYADLIQEGGSYNIWKSFKRLWKLKSITEVRSFYLRLEEKGVNFTYYLQYSKPAYCWTWWTRLGLKHRNLMIALSGIMIAGRKIVKK